MISQMHDLSPTIGYKGWYILLRHNKAVYVGSSMNVATRVGIHRNEGYKPFDHVLCAPTQTRDEALSSERMIYDALRPKYNTRPVSSRLLVRSELATSGDVMSRKPQRGGRIMIQVSEETHDALTREVIRQRRKLGVRVSMGEAVALAFKSKAGAK